MQAYVHLFSPIFKYLGSKERRVSGVTTKDQLLRYLKENRPEWISGQWLSTELGVSRAAINKHVKRLREEGYIIRSSSKKGYVLIHVSEAPLPNEIREGLTTRVFGQADIHYFQEIDSTNTKAKELAEKGAIEGTMVIAESQTRGRGRMGRQWYSSPGAGIYTSLILRPTIPPLAAPKITLMTAVAIAEALLSQLDLDIRIKWPNDILIQGKKLVGILTEISSEMNVVHYIVVGLGLNVNTPRRDFPPELQNIATSLFMETGNVCSRARLIRGFLEQFEKYYNRFKQDDFHHIVARWKQLSNAIGQRIVVDIRGEKHTGTIMDVDDEGGLLLQEEQGKVLRIVSGEIEFYDSQRDANDYCVR